MVLEHPYEFTLKEPYVNDPKALFGPIHMGFGCVLIGKHNEE